MSQSGDRIFFSHITNMYIAPEWGQMSPWGPIFFRIINIQSYCPFPARLKSFPYSNALATYVDLAVKKGQGHHRVMIYIHIVVLEPSILHAKFLFWFWRRRFLKGFYHIWALRPSWSCDLDYLYTH